jgi:hypothetical protein
VLEDGIVNKKADTGSPADGKLTAAEWLSYAVSAVPKLYQDVLDGKRSIIVGDRLLDYEQTDAPGPSRSILRERL